MVMYRFLVENGKITKTWRRDRPSAIGDIVFGPQFQELLEEGGGELRDPPTLIQLFLQR